MSYKVKIVFTVPQTHADVVRQAVGQAGAGKIGNYAFCSFTSTGVGRFKPFGDARPAIGEAGHLEFVDEERIEVTCDQALRDAVLIAIRSKHPYEEPVIDVYPFEERLRNIEDRNARVESDKAWETSWTRRGLLVLFTYLAVGLYLSAIQVSRSWINAIVPALGFMLSTLTMPFFKKWWLKRRRR